MARILDLVILASVALLTGRLLALGLWRRYRVFFVYLIFVTLRQGAMACLSQSSQIYQKLYVLAEPVEWLLYVLVVMEIYALVLQDYKGLATAGRWALIIALAITLLASGVSLMAPSQYAQSRLMTYYYVGERVVYFSLAVFLISILGFLMQYPIVLRRNTIVHSMVFSVYFLGNSFLYMVFSMAGPGTIPAVTYARITVALSLITLTAICTWLVMLTPQGELLKQRLRPQWMPGREEELVSQLNNLNAALLRATGNRPK